MNLILDHQGEEEEEEEEEEEDQDEFELDLEPRFARTLESNFGAAGATAAPAGGESFPGAFACRVPRSGWQHWFSSTVLCIQDTRGCFFFLLQFRSVARMLHFYWRRHLADLLAGRAAEDAAAAAAAAAESSRPRPWAAAAAAAAASAEATAAEEETEEYDDQER